VSATTVYAGLAARFATVNGIKRIILGEPTGAVEPPVLYTAYESFTRGQAGQVTTMTHRFTHRLLLRWQDFSQSEAELLSFVNAIAAAVDADPKLGGRVTSGMARVTGATTGFVTISSTKYRVIDFTTEVLEKGSFQSGI
jgi:hypothetical protein